MAVPLEELRLISLSLLKSVENFKRRHIVEELHESLKRKPGIKLLKGFRGVGKTTALLQVFQEDVENSFYLTADHPLIRATGLYDLGKEAIRSGYKRLLLDEIHTYPNWRREIKALSDEFPSIKLIASGSAPLAFTPERREELISMSPMDLGEFVFLSRAQKLEARDEWLDKEASMKFIASHPQLEGDFYKYTKYGAFPSSLELDEERSIAAIYNSIRTSVREDSVFFLNMSKEKIIGMENLLNSLATSPPGALSITSLSNSLSLSKTSIYEIISTLEAMEIIKIIRPYKRGLSLVRAEPKLLFTHPNLRTALCKQLGRTADIGAVREELALFSFLRKGWSVNTVKGMKKSPDYVIEKNGKRYVVEIGGEGKGRLQLEGFPEGIVIGPYQLIPLTIVAKSSKNAQN